MHSILDAGKTVAELYPKVARITLFVAFEQADAEAEPNYQQIIFTPDAQADFHLGCTRQGCVDGGFDYAPLVAELIHRGEDRTQGQLVCGGRLGSEAAGEPCALQSEYRIFIQGL